MRSEKIKQIRDEFRNPGAVAHHGGQAEQGTREGFWSRSGDLQTAVLIESVPTKNGRALARSRQGILPAKYLLEPAYWHEAPVIEMVSIFHPGASTASSVPKRKRSVMVCPFTLGPRFATVVR